MASAEQRAKRRRVWFDRGAQAVERSFFFDDSPHRRRMYCCPLCGTFHSIADLDSGKLTDEHVPPASLGGKPMVLTCAECNHTSGTKLDVHASSQKKALDLLWLRGGSGPVRLDHGVNARLRVVEGRGHFDIHARHNDPTNLARFEDQVNRRAALADVGFAAGPITHFGVPIHHDDRKANLSYVRAGYLAAFAHYGYRLVFGSAYHPVRSQLRSPDRPIIKRLVIGHTFSDASTKSGLLHGWIRGLGSLLVIRFDTRWVGLPARSDDVDWWVRAEALQRNEVLRAKGFEAIPTRPWHYIDFAQPGPNTGDWERLDFYGDRSV